MKLMPRFWLLVFAFFLGSCESSHKTARGNLDARHGVLAALAKGVYVPSIRAFHDKTSALQAAVQSQCSQPTNDNLKKSRLAWREARNAWARLDVARFGPMMKLRSKYAVDYWPTSPTKIEAIVEGSENIDVTLMSKVGSDVKGLPAIEWLLYQDGGTMATAATAFTEARRCDLLSRLAAALDEAARDVDSAWNEEAGYASAFSGSAGAANLSTQDALSSVVNELVFAVERMAALKLAKPFGLGEERVDATKSESWRSATGRADLVNNLAGIELVYFGKPAESGLQALVVSANAKLDTDIIAAFSTSRIALLALPENLPAALDANPEGIKAVFDELMNLNRLLAVDLSGYLDTTIQFSDNDGD